MGNGSHNIINQFSIDSLARIPCDPIFLALLPQRGILKRPYDATEGVKNINEYGEIVTTYPDAPIVLTDLPMRIEPVRPRGDIGLKIKTQGGEVFANVKIYVCGQVDVKENDSICLGIREYQVLLVEEYYDKDRLHHCEVWCRKTFQI